MESKCPKAYSRRLTKPSWKITSHTFRHTHNVTLMKVPPGMDDTFKYHSHVYVGSKDKPKSQPFGATWTATNLNGKCALELFKFTKAKREMDTMMKEWRLARINAGVPLLKRYETDDIDGDRAIELR
jgi:hypothetical protein